ncbi:MAG: hypothetical protein RL018_1328, partial [Pseudomonadota bacterium]
QSGGDEKLAWGSHEGLRDSFNG